MTTAAQALEALEKAREKTAFAFGGTPIEFTTLRQHIESTAAELEAMKQDALRYRWLRQQFWHDSTLCVVTNPRHAVKLGHDCPSLHRLDAAVDAALNQGGK